MNEIEQPGNIGQPFKHRRRPRYTGTHPKTYEQKYKEHNLAAYPEIEQHLRAKGKTPAGSHIPVLLEKVMTCLKPAPGEIVIDCTLGYGGHAAEFLKHIGPTGKLIALDIDDEELQRTRKRLSNENTPVSFHRCNFAGIAKILKQENLAACDIIFADLGVSSMQIDNPARGLSYKYDGPLDMRMDARLKQTAADLLNTLPEEKLSKCFLEFGDEPDHLQIAREIVARRAKKPFQRTLQLVDVIFEAKGIDIKTWRRQRRDSKAGSLHPAALVFQALRILVNDELGCLKELLRIAPYCLRPAGRIGIISFHSGEDRIVKHAFRDGLKTGIYQSIADDPIIPQPDEIASNPRSSSAKFRWAILKSP
ncbi:MAG: 16S rRNA (cytosine(1402)-N(4))-methyltransferase RsmH [Sedimentisphaerales bacterium]